MGLAHARHDLPRDEALADVHLVRRVRRLDSVLPKSELAERDGRRL